MLKFGPFLLLFLSFALSSSVFSPIVSFVSNPNATTIW
ncbi:hypothetical protein GLYMA_05G072051v4 [Glycine max]|nr:hypothetical protein GLYMA_05G072051v4 [Glycine max]KAH1133199.1 hypothetical protein GYH30_011861 [Glycine max]